MLPADCLRHGGRRLLCSASSFGSYLEGLVRQPIRNPRSNSGTIPDDFVLATPWSWTFRNSSNNGRISDLPSVNRQVTEGNDQKDDLRSIGPGDPLTRTFLGADDGIRTRDPHLGNNNPLKAPNSSTRTFAS